LFPLLRPGGLYIIEDWAWGHCPKYIAPDHPWAGEEPLTRLVVELIEAAGTSSQLIWSIVMYRVFVVVEHGPQQLDKATHFNLEDHIIRRPGRRQLGLFLRLVKKLQRKIGRFANRFRS